MLGTAAAPASRQMTSHTETRNPYDSAGEPEATPVGEQPSTQASQH